MNQGNRCSLESTTLLQSRRLLPKESHVRNLNSEICCCSSKTRRQNNSGSGDNENKIQHGKEQKRGQDSTNNNNGRLHLHNHLEQSLNRQTSSRPRKAFETKPFYNEVKPHVTTQKRVRYIHLEDEGGAIEKKRMPKEVIDGPKIYQRDDVVGTKTEKNRKAPISLNPIFHDTSMYEDS